MDTNPPPGDAGTGTGTGTGTAETLTAEQRRLAWEAHGIAEARADIAAGRVIDAAEVDAWIDSLDTDHALPVPFAGR
jgi:hypothetical protein